MEYTINSKNFDNLNEKNIELQVDAPNICPCCNIVWQPNFVYSIYTKNSFFPQNKYYYNDYEVFEEHEKNSYKFLHIYEYAVNVIWFCTNCNEVSISKYVTDGKSNTRFWCSFPKKSEKKFFCKEINELSPSFEKIYNEALIAECNNLYEIAGMGYRKALEFLVKDYAIKRKPEDKKIIEDSLLSRCINDYIDNPRAKAVAKRTAWVGNDQTHYVKLHKELDLEDLKTLLNLSLSYVTMDLQTDEAMKITAPPNAHKFQSTNSVNGNYNAVNNSTITVNTPILDEHIKLLIELYNKLSPIEQVELIAKLNDTKK